MNSNGEQWSGPASGGAGLNWEQFQSAQIASQLAPRSVLVCRLLDKPIVDYTLVRGPIGNNFSRPRLPVNWHQGLY